jgi:hypothetical protein
MTGALSAALAIQGGMVVSQRRQNYRLLVKVKLRRSASDEGR